MQPVERLQSREEQDQRLDQTRRDASSNKDRGVRDFCIRQYQLHDLQRQEVQQQRESKEPAPSEEKDPLNEVAIGTDGKPIEKQVNPQEHYDNNYPGVPESANFMKSICDVLSDSNAKLNSGSVSRFILKYMVNMIREESAEQKDMLIGGHYKDGLKLLERAEKLDDDKGRQTSIEKAAIQFISASDVKYGTGFMQAKSMFYTAVCYHLLGKRDTAMNWYGEAYQKGYEQGEKFIGQIHEMQEKGQMKYYFLEKLLKGYGLKLVKANPTDFNYPTCFGFVGITGLAAIGASWYYTAQANEAIDKMKAFNNEFMVPLGNMLDSCPATSRRAATQEYLSIPDKKHHWLSSILPGDFCCESK